MNKYKEKLVEYSLPLMLSILLATILQIPQLFNHVALTGSDTIFHFSRFYDTAQQIKNHNFFYFQMNYGMGETGRIVNAIYGPFFAYLMGSLLLIAGSWFNYQIILVYLIFIIAGLGMYILARKVKLSRPVALIISTLFLLCGYISYWIPSNSFNAWGAALMPYVLIQGLNLFNDDKKHFNWINLATTMAIVAQVHLLSTLQAILVLIPLFIYGLVTTKNKKRMWTDTLKAVVLCLILTANVWGAFLVLYPKNTMSAPLDFSPALTVLHLKSNGTITMWTEIQEVVLLLFGLQIVYIIFNYRVSKLNTFLTIEGLVFLFISSDLFPWRVVEKYFPSFSNYFQFPNRFTAVAYPLLFLSIGLTVINLINRYDFQFKIFIECLLIFVCLFSLRADLRGNIIKFNKVKTNVERISQFRDHDLSKFIDSNPPGNPDYLPLKKQMNSWKISGLVSGTLIFNNGQGFEKEAASNGRLEISWNSKGEDATLPIVFYSQSELVVNGKKVLPKRNEIGMPIVKSKVGKNTAILSFKTPTWFTVLLYISILSWVLLIIYGVFRWVKIIKN